MAVYFGEKCVDGGGSDHDRGTIQDWIDRINDEGRNLTDWELEFMVSITDQWNRSGSLSEKQTETLERIYCDRVD